MLRVHTRPINQILKNWRIRSFCLVHTVWHVFPATPLCITHVDVSVLWAQHTEMDVVRVFASWWGYKRKTNGRRVTRPAKLIQKKKLEHFCADLSTERRRTLSYMEAFSCEHLALPIWCVRLRNRTVNHQALEPEGNLELPGVWTDTPVMVRAETEENMSNLRCGKQNYYYSLNYTTGEAMWVICTIYYTILLGSFGIISFFFFCVGVRVHRGLGGCSVCGEVV